MEVRLTPDIETKLSRMAEEQGRPTESLVEEAVARMIEHDDWFRTEVDQGLGEAERGEFLLDGEIRRMIDSRYPG